MKLNEVLIALKYKWDQIDFNPQYPEEIDIYCHKKEGYITWDLNKQTLEEQDEDTKNKINDLLTNPSNKEEYYGAK